MPYQALQKHDILGFQVYENAGFRIVDFLEIEDFHFVHEPTNQKMDKYVIHGHIHPAVMQTPTSESVSKR